MTTTADGGSLGALWGRIRRPVDVPSAVEALVGIPSATARQLVSATVAGSDEAAALLDVMPELLRHLSISTVAVPERSMGEMRGPVLWSETVAARSASAGDQNVFVCATSGRAYDTAENRLLAAALALVVRGGREIERLGTRGPDEPPLLTAARRQGERAHRFLEHRALSGVRRDKVSRRALARLHHDPRRRAYRPVTDMLRLASDPLDVPTIQRFCDEATTAEHDLLLGVAEHLERRGISLPPFLVADHALVAGPLRYQRAAHPTSGAVPGVSVGHSRFSVPSSPRPDAAVVEGRAGLIAAVDAAIVAEGL